MAKIEIESRRKINENCGFWQLCRIRMSKRRVEDKHLRFRKYVSFGLWEKPISGINKKPIFFIRKSFPKEYQFKSRCFPFPDFAHET